MAFESAAVANFFLNTVEEAKEEITHLKLQKLMYFAHGWHLSLIDKPLIDERIEAWKFGPVIPSVYHDLKRFGLDPIGSYRIRSINWVGTGLKFVATIPIVSPNKDEESQKSCAVMREVWNVYGKFSAIQLSSMTHQPDTPWYNTWHMQEGKLRTGTDISDASIKSYFDALRAKSQ